VTAHPASGEPPFDVDYDVQGIDDHAPPQSRSAEQALLGSIMNEPTTATHAATLLDGDDFYYPHHETIWDAIHAVTATGATRRSHPRPRPPHPHQATRQIGGGPYLFELVQAGFYGQLDEYARIVRDAARLRTASNAAPRSARPSPPPDQRTSTAPSTTPSPTLDDAYARHGATRHVPPLPRRDHRRTPRRRHRRHLRLGHPRPHRAPGTRHPHRRRRRRKVHPPPPDRHPGRRRHPPLHRLTDMTRSPSSTSTSRTPAASPDAATGPSASKPAPSSNPNGSASSSAPPASTSPPKPTATGSSTPPATSNPTSSSSAPSTSSPTATPPKRSPPSPSPWPSTPYATETDCAVILEAHAAKAPTGTKKRPHEPYGWSGWLRWPEVGLWLDKDGSPLPLARSPRRTLLAPPSSNAAAPGPGPPRGRAAAPPPSRCARGGDAGAAA
jgi:hypothetical protein